MKLCGQIGLGPRTYLLDFGGDIGYSCDMFGFHVYARAGKCSLLIALWLRTKSLHFCGDVELMVVQPYSMDLRF